MLTLFAKHGLFDLNLKAKGDVDVDYHHTVEDVGLVLGQAFKEALGDKLGIRRYGFFLLPMDESLAQVALDLSGRAWLVFDAKFPPGTELGAPLPMAGTDAAPAEPEPDEEDLSPPEVSSGPKENE